MAKYMEKKMGTVPKKTSLIHGLVILLLLVQVTTIVHAQTRPRLADDEGTQNSLALFLFPHQLFSIYMMMRNEI